MQDYTKELESSVCFYYNTTNSLGTWYHKYDSTDRALPRYWGTGCEHINGTMKTEEKTHKCMANEKYVITDRGEGMGGLCANEDDTRSVETDTLNCGFKNPKSQFCWHYGWQKC